MKSKDHQRKRKRRELLDFKAYESMTIKSRPSMGRPGSPHRFFASSYHVTTVPGEIETSNDDSNANTASKQSYSSQGQIVHRHVNGLCIITVGKMIQEALNNMNQNRTKDESNAEPVSVHNISFMVEITDAQSVGGKRKGNRLQHGHLDDGNKKRNGAVGPSDTVAVVEFSNGTKVEVKSCVLGTVLELNQNLQETPSLLVNDPLLDGFIAVIMPSGPYPPKELLNDIEKA